MSDLGKADSCRTKFAATRPRLTCFLKGPRLEYSKREPGEEEDAKIERERQKRSERLVKKEELRNREQAADQSKREKKN